MKIGKIACAAVLALTGLWPVEGVGATASQVGIWKKNAAESLNMADPGGSETVEIRRHDTVLDYTWTGTGSDGKTETFSYAGPVDGKEQKLPGDTGLRGAMIPTPDGVIEGKLWFPDGSIEDKYCLLTTPRKLTCFATFTDGAGKASLFKEVFDKQ
jgi:hypothetical protein